MPSHTSRTFACQHLHFRLFAIPEAQGWKAAVFDTDSNKPVYRPHHVFENVERAQQHARVWAEGKLNRPLRNLEWIEWSDPVPDSD